MKNNACPFCHLTKERILLENEHSIAVYDGFPVSIGHTLIIPRRHCQSCFDLSQDELYASIELLTAAKKLIDSAYSPLGYNIGINDDPAAGQTVPHCHIHLIPRYAGDRDDPRGGVRWILPEKAKYWED
jgi:diadenosine tetraphosphate (Ap4A) HIT family hydrolase